MAEESVEEAETRPAPASPPNEEAEVELDAAADAAASRAAPIWDAGGRALTIAFWGGIVLFIAALFRTTSLPFVDYPQHLALAATLRRMMSSGAPERLLFETNIASYNSLFHVLVASLNLVLPIDAAGKVVVGAYVALTGLSVLALLRATGRPRARAFLVMPLIIGYSIAWGFVNFGLGAAVQMLVLSRVLDHRPAKSLRDALVRDGVTALLAVFGAWTHLLASALVYMLMLVVIVVRVQTEKGALLERLGRAIRIGLPLLPAVAYCAWVYVRQKRMAFQNFEYGAYEGNDVFGMVKVKEFFGYATGYRTDLLDQKMLSITVGLLLIGAFLRDPDDETPAPLRYVFFASVVSYFVIPHVFWATNFVFERITFFIIVAAILWTPRALPKFEWMLRLMYCSVGLGCAYLFWGTMGVAGEELADMDAIIAMAPKGRRVTGLVWDPKIPSTRQWSLIHSPAYYVARNGGEVAFSFTRTMSLPVHYTQATMPPDPPANFEWNPGDYRPNTPYAKYFDLVLMKTTHDDGKDPRASVWGEHANEVDVVAHRGRWWIFETKRVTADPPPVFPTPTFGEE